MRRWFTADLHLSHANIITYTQRPFASVQEMDAELIRRINATVDPEDELWILGDVALGKIDESLAWVREIRCTPRLISGNHDRCWGGHRRPSRVRAERQRYLDAGFATIDDEHDTTIAGVRVTLSHFPFAGDHTDRDRFSHARPADEGQWLVCGHVHNAWRQIGRQINVGVDVRDFTPVSEDEIAEIIAQGPVE